MKPYVIGLTGYAKSGKDEVARILDTAHSFAHLKFAAPLKLMLRSLGLTLMEIEGDLKEAPNALLCGHSPRHAMQTLGTDWGRKIMGDQFWVNLCQENTRRYLQQGFNVVISDVRFPNEAEMIKRMGGHLVRVVRPDNVVRLAHESESYIAELKTDLLIVNDGSLVDLQRSVAMMLHEIECEEADRCTHS